MNRKLKLTELGRLSKSEFKEADKTPVVVVLDNIRSLHNVGSVFRTADAFRLKHIYLCGYTPTPPHREIRKTAIGAEDTVAWTHAESTTQVIENLKVEGYQILAIEQTETTVPLNEFEPSGETKYAVVLGNEVEGVSQEAVDLADTVLEIPQIGTKHSLNVSVCAGIVLWHLFRVKFKV